MLKSLGLIETVGLAAAFEAADTAVKTANVILVGYELTKGGGWVTVKIIGEVAEVKAAINAAKLSASSVNKVIGQHVIARPGDDIDQLIYSSGTIGRAAIKNDLLSAS